MNPTLRQIVTQRALGRCEYCHYPEKIHSGVLHLDHIIPPQHGGKHTAENRALSCPKCNLRKSNKINGVDSSTGQTVRLFHPRQDKWDEHFVLHRQNNLAKKAKGKKLKSPLRGTKQSEGFSFKAKITMTLSDSLPCHFKATDYDGALYLFAQNIDLSSEPEKKRQFEQIAPRPGRATITVEGLKAGAQVEVIDEDRVLTAEEGQFTDDFAPLSEHIYKL